MQDWIALILVLGGVELDGDFIMLVISFKRAALPRSSEQCKCDTHGLSYCVFGRIGDYPREPNCDLFDCCQSETGDEGRNDCLVRDEAQLRYGECINEWLGSTKDFCYCDRSNMLCTSGHSDADTASCLAVAKSSQMV
jgi:hypothetical protein